MINQIMFTTKHEWYRLISAVMSFGLWALSAMQRSGQLLESIRTTHTCLQVQVYNSMLLVCQFKINCCTTPSSQDTTKKKHFYMVL